MWVPKLETGFSKPEALVRALKRAIESGELKGKKIGATWRITRANLDAYLNG